MSTEEKDLEENKEEKAKDDCAMKEKGEEECLGKKDSTEECKKDDEECQDQGEAA